MSRFLLKTAQLLGSNSGRPVQTMQFREISTTNALYAEPPRKKRRIDPAVLRSRVERKIKKAEREIAKLENEPRQLIPILEYQLTNSEIRDLNSRPGRTLRDVGLDEGALMAAQKLWSFYRLEQSRMEKISIRRVERAQNRALETLRELDEDLYNKTVAMDETSLIPYLSSHIRKETPPNPNYTPPDGHIKNISKEWVM